MARAGRCESNCIHSNSFANRHIDPDPDPNPNSDADAYTSASLADSHAGIRHDRA
jgi:hypothetical protein